MRAEAFFEQVPDLFRDSKPHWEKAYNGLIYQIVRPLSRENAQHAVQWLDGGKLPALGPKEMETLNTVLLRILWPDVRSLTRLRAIEGMTLPRATALLHFHNPSFPPFTKEAVEGLKILGNRARRPEGLKLDDVRAYRRYMDLIVELKDGIPYRFVPESHYFHVWVLEACLAELARQGGARR